MSVAYRHRSSITGRFITKKQADLKKKTSVRERVKVRKFRKRKVRK